MTAGLVRLFRAPLFQFLVLGAALYAGYTWVQDPPPEPSNDVIRVTSADVSRLDAAWRARWGRAPTREELAGLVKSHAREIALYRHAVSLGLDRNDLAVRRMLGQKLQGMIQSLVEMGVSPTEADLRSYFEANRARFKSPDLITFTHLFLDPDLRDKQTLEDAKRILGKLRAQEKPTERIETLGDPFMLQRYYPGKSAQEIAKLFGQGFTESLFGLAPRAWHGPVLSGYGVHLVYVHALQEGATPGFEAARERVQREWMDAKRKEIQSEYVNRVLSSYEVIIEDPETESASQAIGAASGGD